LLIFLSSSEGLFVLQLNYEALFYIKQAFDTNYLMPYYWPSKQEDTTMQVHTAQVGIRMPKLLKRRAKAAARRKKQTLSTWIKELIEREISSAEV